MRIVVRTLFGIIYVIFKHVNLLLASILALIWYMNVKCVKELYKDSDVFYISLLFHDMERYRYNTIKDFIFDKKDYTNRWDKHSIK